MALDSSQGEGRRWAEDGMGSGGEAGGGQAAHPAHAEDVGELWG